MPKLGRTVIFHGAFGSKEAARKKERQVGGTILERRIKRKLRYVVITKRRR